MVCPAKILNLLNPVSLLGTWLILFSFIEIHRGYTYINDENDNIWNRDRKLYYNENPRIFSLIISVKIFLGLYIMDFINNFGLIRFFKFLFGIN